jgi:transcriptional regulator with XRE-family HTH domain
VARKKTSGGPPRGGRKPGEWTTVTPEQILEFRRANQISRAKLAAALGVSSTTIQNWETGQGVAMPKLQAKVAELIKAGGSAVASARPTPGVGWDPSVVVGPQVTATGTIVTGYLQSQQQKLSTDELIDLIRAVRGALT